VDRLHVGLGVKSDATASWVHYYDHLAPIFAALPDDSRGTFYAPRDVIQQRPNRGLVEGVPDRKSTDLLLTAGFSDVHLVRPDRRCVLLNHGAGQRYALTKSPESFSGGPGRDRVALHLEWGPLAARATADAGYPFAAVGCPYLDKWHHTSAIPEQGLVAVALHHTGRGAPEQMNAFVPFEAAFADLAQHVKLVGHGHPRGWERTRNRWHKLGVESEPSFAKILDRAALLVTDISSAGPMFASTGRPVVWISAPWHTAAPWSGGRFHEWTDHVEHAHGHVTDPRELSNVVAHHLYHPQRLVEAQRPIVEDVFFKCDGFAASRAAAAIMDAL
jgi:hypothetical protein